MTRHQILWRAETGSADVLLDDGMTGPFVVSLTPVVTADGLGVRVGMLHRSHDSFGYWTGDRSTDPITAWRTARVLTRVDTLNVRGYRSGGNDIAAVTDLFGRKLNTESPEFNRASEILRISPSSLQSLVAEMMEERPDGRTMFHLWYGMPDSLQDRHRDLLAIYVERYAFDVSDRLRQLHDTIELRVRTREEQVAREAALIEAGVPEAKSLQAFLSSVGVENLLHTDPGDFGPSHFGRSSSRTMDQQILGLLIGDFGYASEVLLLTTELEPDDPSAHSVSGGGGVTVYMSNFGESVPPGVMIDGSRFKLMGVRWDRVTERFVLRVRPYDVSSDDASKDVWRPLDELQGVATALKRPGRLRRMFGARPS